MVETFDYASGFDLKFEIFATFLLFQLMKVTVLWAKRVLDLI